MENDRRRAAEKEAASRRAADTCLDATRALNMAAKSGSSLRLVKARRLLSPEPDLSVGPIH